MTQNRQVRAPSDSDFLRWRELYRGYADSYGVEQPDTAARLVWSWIKTLSMTFEPYSSRTSRVRRGPRALPNLSAPSLRNDRSFLDDLFVDAAMRGDGAVDALLAELRRLAREHGWSVVRWITADDNHRARAKYHQVATHTMWITYDMVGDERCTVR